MTGTVCIPNVGAGDTTLSFDPRKPAEAAITYAADGETAIRKLALTGWQKPYKTFDYQSGKGWVGSSRMPRWARRDE